MLSCYVRYTSQFRFTFLSLPGYIPHRQRMDLLTFFIREQLYRVQILRPAFRLLGVLHFRADQCQGNLLTLLILEHIKSSNSVLKRTKKKASGLNNVRSWHKADIRHRVA